MKYRTTRSVVIDDKTHAAGSTLDLAAEAAAPLVKLGALQSLEPKVKKANPATPVAGPAPKSTKA